MSENKVSLALVPIIGLAFATTAISWSMFNTIVPVFLEDKFNISLTFIGFIMTWDNIIAFFIQPWIGARSDRTKSRIGRRMPYIIPGILLGAIFYYNIYLASTQSVLLIFLGSIVIFNLSMALYRSPAVSLMPDMVSSKDRPVANAIVNLMGGIFAGISLFVGGGMLKSGNTSGAFLLVSGVMIFSLLILVALVREPKHEFEEKEDEPSVFSIVKQESKRIWHAEDKSLLFMFFALFSWFVAWNAIEAFYSIYVAKVYLPDSDRIVAAGVASEVLSIFPVVFVVFTILGGLLGQKIGRIITMKIGLIIMLSSIISATQVKRYTFLGIDMFWTTSFRYIFIVAAIGWAFININSIVVVWELSIDNGTGTGMYYAFSSLAAIVGPTLVGILIDINIEIFFPFSITFLIIAFILLFRVKSGELGDSELLNEAMEEMVD